MRGLSQTIVYYILIIVLLMTIGMELFVAFFIEKPKNIKEAGVAGYQAVINIQSGKLLTHLFTIPVPGEIIPANKQNEATKKQEIPTLNTAQDKRPKIVIIIKDLGMDSALTATAMTMPNSFNLGFSAYSDDLENLMIQAQSKDFEVLLNLPMELTDYPASSSEPKALVSDLPLAENLRRLNYLITISKNCALYTDENENFTRSIQEVKNLIEVLALVNKDFIYGADSTNTIILQMAEDTKFPVIVRDLTIDNKISDEAIDSNLQKLENIAKKRGFAVGYANPHALTLTKLKEWYITLASKGIKLANVSELSQSYFGNDKQAKGAGNE